MEYAHPYLGFFMEFSVCDGFYPLGQLVEFLEEFGPLAVIAIERGPEPLLHPLMHLPVLLYDLSGNLFKAEVAGPGSEEIAQQGAFNVSRQHQRLRGLPLPTEGHVHSVQPHCYP